MISTTMLEGRLTYVTLFNLTYASSKRWLHLSQHTVTEALSTDITLTSQHSPCPTTRCTSRTYKCHLNTSPETDSDNGERTPNQKETSGKVCNRQWGPSPPKEILGHCPTIFWGPLYYNKWWTFWLIIQLITYYILKVLFYWCEIICI